MFSQLCRAKPSLLWSKFGIGQSADTENNRNQRTSDTELDEDRCQLEHCTFCDFRVCCQVTPVGTLNDGETEYTQNPDPDALVTENPAYGLSSKNWLEPKEVEEDETHASKVENMMESPENLIGQNANCDTQEEHLIPNVLPVVRTASQQDQDCDANTVPKMNQVNSQSHGREEKMELKAIRYAAEETAKQENSCRDIAKHGKLTWSVLRHRQFSGDVLRNCDNKAHNVIEHATHDPIQQADSQDRTADVGFTQRTKRNTKDNRPFPLSLVRPIAKIGDNKKPETSSHFNPIPKNDLSRQRPVQRHTRERFQLSSTPNRDADKSKRLGYDILGMNNPLSDIAQIKSEESVQEWLTRIGESVNNAWPTEDDKSIKEIPPPPPPPPRQPWSLVNNTDEEKGRDNSKQKSSNYPADAALYRSAEISGDFTPKSEVDTCSALSNATKASPANVPMVVMQCSRLHSRIDSKPPYQHQASLPMGTLVTALYQDSEWLYVQTPHGIEGFVAASNCAPMGTINEPAQAKKPWEPCDFPIQICLRRQHELGKQQGSYIPAKLPINSGKQAAPYVSTVKMKTNFYSDRYFSHTFKSKDSIKTAKTVTDILRSSPDTKVSNQ